MPSASFESKTTENASIQAENASIQAESASIQIESASIQAESESIRQKDALIKRIIQLKEAGTISQKDATNVKTIITDMDIMQVITVKEVMSILSCQTTKGRSVLKMMEMLGLIKTVQGKGKGKYILNVFE